MSQALRNTTGLRPAWQPGQSGNELGAHRGYRRVLALARKNSPEAMEAIIACMRDPDASWRERLTAATVILDRAWGKPKEQFSFEGADGANILIVTGVPRTEDTNTVADETKAVAGETTYTIELDAEDTA